MSLMKRRTMTGKQKAAARANGSRSQGPATREGRENIRAANLRHGLFSQAEDIVFESLGEDRARFEALREGIYDSFPLASVSHPDLVDELQAALWRLERVDRRQEELDMERQSALADWEVTPEQTRAFDPALALRLMSIEAVTSREVCRLSTNFLDLEQEERKRPLTGLPEKMLKTKGDRIGECEQAGAEPVDRPSLQDRGKSTRPI
jgi:hypothetical protein